MAKPTPPAPPTLKAFFGDAERSFALPPELIVELERLCDAGIGTIILRVLRHQFRHADMLQTIRLGLIGGGESPQVADSLMTVYAGLRPITEVLPVATAILETVYLGKPIDAPKVQE